MSINKIDANGGRLTLHGDRLMYHQDHIEFELEGDRLPANLRGCHKGDIFITDLRLIYINEGSSGYKSFSIDFQHFCNEESSGYKSFSMDFQHIRNEEVKQLTFESNANYVKGFIKAEPGGGWEGSANFKVNFPKGGAIDFAFKFQNIVRDSLRTRQFRMLLWWPPQQPVFYGSMGMPPGGNYYPPPRGQYYPLPQPAYYVYRPCIPPQGCFSAGQ